MHAHRTCCSCTTQPTPHAHRTQPTPQVATGHATDGGGMDVIARCVVCGDLTRCEWDACGGDGRAKVRACRRCHSGHSAAVALAAEDQQVAMGCYMSCVGAWPDVGALAIRQR